MREMVRICDLGESNRVLGETQAFWGVGAGMYRLIMQEGRQRFYFINIILSAGSDLWPCSLFASDLSYSGKIVCLNQFLVFSPASA